jgi:hypothetical protein
MRQREAGFRIQLKLAELEIRKAMSEIAVARQEGKIEGLEIASEQFARYRELAEKRIMEISDAHQSYVERSSRESSRADISRYVEEGANLSDARQDD